MFRHDILGSTLIDNQCFYLLDIGAHDGDWATTQKRFNTELYVYCIEGNEKNSIELSRKFLPHKIAILSDVEKEVKFYLNKNNDTCTGTSYYKENNDYYLPENYIVKKTTTLDDILKDQDITYDSIKIDTQGSELDILKGASEYIDNFKVICLDTSLEEYNIGSPDQDEVVKYMDSIDYKISGLCGEGRYPNGKLLQQDLIFTKK